MKPWFITKDDSEVPSREPSHLNSELLINLLNEGYFLSKRATYHWGYIGLNPKIEEIFSSFNDYLSKPVSENKELGRRKRDVRQRTVTFRNICKDFIWFAQENDIASVSNVIDQENDSDIELANEILKISGAEAETLVLVGSEKVKSGGGTLNTANNYISTIEKIDISVIKEGVDSLGESNIEITSVNTILEGVAGCGKTYFQKSLFDSQDINGHLGFDPERSETVVFHPSTSYEDFVSGLRPQKDEGFTGKAGIFVELCNRAAADSKNNYLLFIDEINRANTAKVFGDLLMVIEESKRTPVAVLETYKKRAVLTRSEAKSLGITSVRLQTAIDTLPEKAKPPVGKDKDDVDLEYLAVPDNLYIVGTMNSTDRSVGTIDLALRRRFTWHTMEPMDKKDKLEESLGNRKEKLQDIIEWYLKANVALYNEVGPDARLGHSYFFQEKKSAEQIAKDLLKQLAEIAYIFHLEDLMTESPFNQTVKGHRLEMPGHGLGKRVIVAFASTSSDTESPDGGAESLESSDESSESSADEG